MHIFFNFLKKYELFPFLSLILALFSCHKTPSHKEKRPLRLNFTYMPFTCDPRMHTEPLTATFHYMLYEGLTHLNPDGQVSLALASDVIISSDKKSYLFTLKESLWSDGSPLTAFDFERSWKEVLDPSFPSKAAHLLYPIKNGEKAKKGLSCLYDVGVKALSPHTLLVELEYPTPYFLELTSYCTYFPFPSTSSSKKASLSFDKLISNGPFTLAYWRNQDAISLKKNPYFWKSERVLIETIDISIIPHESTALDLFNQGKIDWIGGMISPLPAQTVPHLIEKGTIKTRPIAGTTFCLFNTECPPFDNLNIRKAFGYAIDRKALVEHITQMPDEVATGLIPPALKRKPQAYLLPLDSQNLANIYFEKGLKELGMTRETFPPITYHYFHSDLHCKLALSLQHQVQETLGIQINVIGSPIQDHFALLRAHLFQCAQLSWIAHYLDPMNFLERFSLTHSRRNHSGWANPLFHHLLSQSYDVEGEKRERLLDEMETLILDDLPLVPFYHYPLVYMQSSSLKEVEISPLGGVQFHHAYFDDRL